MSERLPEEPIIISQDTDNGHQRKGRCLVFGCDTWQTLDEYYTDYTLDDDGKYMQQQGLCYWCNECGNDVITVKRGLF